MSFTEAVSTCYAKKYATFNGRASRSEFWWFYLAYAGTILVLYFIDLMLVLPTATRTRYGSYSYDPPAVSIFIGLLITVVALGSIVPYLAAVWRRLHDTNRSGAYFFMTFIPFAGPIILLVLLATEGHHGPNMYGPDPLDPRGQTAGFVNPYAQPYGAVNQPYGAAQPQGQQFGQGAPVQPYGYGARGTGAPAQGGQPYGTAAQPYGRPPAPQPYGQGGAQPYDQGGAQPYGTAAAPGQPATSPYGQPTGSPYPPGSNQPPVAGQAEAGSDQGDQQGPYGFDFTKPEGYGRSES